MSKSEKTDLDALVSEWKDRLGLQTWEVKTKWARQNELGSSGSEGDVSFERQSMKATVRVLDEADWYDIPFGIDPEHVIVHELLHLTWGAVSPEKDTETHVQFEQAINITASALVALKRRSSR